MSVTEDLQATKAITETPEYRGLMEKHAQAVGAIIALNRLDIALISSGLYSPVGPEICFQRNEWAKKRDDLASQMSAMLQETKS